VIEDNHIYKSHNKSLLLYHLVFVIKYRKKIITNDVEEYIKEICENIENGYEIKFIEIGFDQDHVHFLLQSVPNLSITKIVTTVKSIMARELFKYKKEIKRILYNGNFWTSGYYVNTVGEYGNKEVIRKYIENQGKEYKKEYKQVYIKEQLCFDFMYT
jgi:REP element-mobilizing transposase RayT